MNYPGILFKKIIILTLLITPIVSWGQKKDRKSPLSVVTTRYQDTYIKIVYSQPAKRGRKIFGELVPWGKVWRTGANEATEMTVTGDIEVNGNVLKKGTYSLFTIPQKDHWTMIINADVGLWGSYNYNPQKDVMRFTVPVQHIKNEANGINRYESFTIDIEDKNDKAEIALKWDNVKVSFPIKYR